jgi:hypothetical protein
MFRTSWMRLAALSLIFTLGTVGCRGSEDSEETDVPRSGEVAEVLLQDGTTTSGYVVTVLRRDGSRVPALFRGPVRLAEEASGGDFEFDEDSLPSRVQLLAPGAELRRPGGHLR